MPCNVAAYPAAACTECQYIARAHDQRTADRHGRAVHRGAQVGAGQSDAGRGVEAQRGPHEGDFERGQVALVSGNEIGQLVRTQVHGTAYGHAQMLKTVAAGVLEGACQAGANDGDAHACGQFVKSCSVMGTKRTLSPGATVVAGWRSGSNRTSGVRPMMFQPPGDAFG